MEYEVLGIPRPDAIIYLRMPLHASLKLLSEKRAAKNKSLETEKDTVEGDLNYLTKSYEAANWLAEREGNWNIIQCEANEKIRSREDIHIQIVSLVSEMIENAK